MRRSHVVAVCICGLLGLLLGLVGCAAPPRASSPSYSAPSTPARAATYTHQYKVTAVDVAGSPVSGVAVQVTLTAKGTTDSTVSCVTDERGQCAPFAYEVNRDPSLTYVTSYSSSAKAAASKDGYYATTGSGLSFAGSSTSSSATAGLSDIKLKMVRPLDYLDDGFATSDADRDLRERVLRFLTVIRVQSVLNDAEVMLKGVGTSEFKGKKYLRLRVNSTTTYNSLKLNKYDMGKRLFDDTVRKVLNPLNDNIAVPRAYFGYDIVVYGHSKSFAEKYATADKVEYRFLMPEAAVRRYKDKDISGQALLDGSVQLMDDERIELKLQ